MWRKDLADTINATNEQLGIALHWEHRSFKEQGIDREPTIHIGAVANALERKGIQTERGNINREIIRNNMLLEQAKEMLIHRWEYSPSLLRNWRRHPHSGGNRYRLYIASP